MSIKGNTEMFIFNNPFLIHLLKKLYCKLILLFLIVYKITI